MAISAAVKLGLYNDALRLLGEKRLSSLTQEREARHFLDGAWEGAADYCLEMGMWKFAIRTVSLTYSPSIEPAFSYAYAFDKPEDLIRVTGVFGDENLGAPLLSYRDEGEYWYAPMDTIYVSYVSSDTAFGYNSSIWTGKFKKFFAAYLAFEIVNDVKKDADEGLYRRIERTLHDRLLEARSHDAQQGPTVFPPVGSWVSTRAGGWRGDRGSRSRLFG